mgnify:CR=1 FL=1
MFFLRKGLMDRKRKVSVLLAAAVFAAALIGVLICGFVPPYEKTALQAAERPQAKTAVGISGGGFRNIILIGWDGAQREHLKELMGKGKVPNLKKLISNGAYLDIEITTGATDTKAGWAQILTGYDPRKTGVFDNRDYGPIPKGYTIHERLEKFFGDENITTILLSGKQHNLGTRGVHNICLNCVRQGWFNGDTAVAAIKGQAKKLKEMKGEPYLYSHKGIDIFENGLNNADAVGAKVLEHIEKNRGNRFFMFVEFREPDQPGGHTYGENSTEYSQGIMLDDEWLGKIMAKLKELGIHGSTLIYITSDHGFDEGQKEHSNAPRVFLATNDTMVTARQGDRKDIAPTIMKRFGMDIGKVEPKLDGRSLLNH